MNDNQRPPAVPARPGVFDPFQDRTSRDIRNSLSSALAQAIAEGNPATVEELAASLLADHVGQPYRSYIESRLARYHQALAAITGGSADPLWQGLILWDLQLFFEMHEVLEHAWYHAEGTKKLLLQAMIRAAGVYVKLEYDYRQQAAKMAAKALEVLELNEGILRQYFEPEKLLDALKTLNPRPPRLLGDTDTTESLTKEKASGKDIPEA
jgi:hypothetical protein